MKFIMDLFRRKNSAHVVRQRLKQVLATDRLSTAPTLIDKIKQAVSSVLCAEMGENNIVFDVYSTRTRGKTELSFNMTFASELQEPAA